MIELRGVSKVFPSSTDPAVRDLSLDVERGHVVVLLGPSGCGKTTTMKMINRLIEPTSGSIRVDGVDVLRQDPVKLRRGIGYVIQSIGLMPHRTVAQNIATVPVLEGWERDRIQARTEELAEMLELDSDLLARYPAELSGGQRQRVGVARALAVDPPVMLMDEPFGAVDPIVRERLQNEFLRLQRELAKTILFVTHDVDEAIKLGDLVAVMQTGGTLAQFGTPQAILADPASEFVARFVGADRGLKRLALLYVRDLPNRLPATAHPGDDASDARRRALADPFPYLLLLDSAERPIGWIDERTIPEDGRLSPAMAAVASAVFGPDTTLRDALSEILATDVQAGLAVDEGGGVRGVVTVDAIGAVLRRSVPR